MASSRSMARAHHRGRGSLKDIALNGTEWITLSQALENDEASEPWVKQFVDIESGDVFR